jgi:hypothetical protein
MIRIPNADPHNEIKLVKFLRARCTEALANGGDPADIESKRRIVDLCSPPLVEVTGAGDRERTFVPGRGFAWGEPVLLLLALPYESHPDYDEGWRQ